MLISTYYYLKFKMKCKKYIIINMKDIKDLKILYFGTPEISSYVLENLLNDGFNIIGVVTQIDKPVGRKGILTPSKVKEVALKHNIKVYQFTKLKNEFESLLSLDVDIILTLAYGQIIPHELLMLPSIGAYNLHGSILPSLRGASPIQTSLLNGDKITGVTLMEMVDKMDAGRMFYVKKVNIEDDDNYTSLTDKLKVAAYLCFKEGIEDVVSKVNLGIIQDETKATFTKKILKEDELLSFFDDATTINNKIRALSYTPGSYFMFNNEKYKILKAKVVNVNSQAPSTILEYNKNSMVIGCKNNAISVIEIQRQGKKILSFKDFYNGNMNLFKIGDKLN